MIEDRAETYARNFFTNYFKNEEQGVPKWVVNALNECGIALWFKSLKIKKELKYFYSKLDKSSRLMYTLVLIRNTNTQYSPPRIQARQNHQ